MSSKFLVLILFCCLQISVIGQTIKGKVIDSQTLEALSYVHIGIVGKNMGVISKENGSFEINLDKGEVKDSLTFSMIGYETQSMLLKGIADNNLLIKLNPTNYSLSLVTVADSRLVKKSNLKKKSH